MIGPFGSFVARGVMREPAITKSISLNGTSQYAGGGVIDAFNFERTAAFSGSCWVKSTDANGAILGTQDDGVEDRGWRLAIDSGKLGLLLISASGTSNYIYVTSNTTINDGAWHHVAFTYDGSSTASGATLYLDGAATAQTTVTDGLTGTMVRSANTFDLGKIDTSPQATLYLAGKLCAAAIYGAALTAADIAILYNGGTPHYNTVPLSASALGFWRLGNGDTHPTLSDLSGNGHDLTLVNATSANIVDDAP